MNEYQVSARKYRPNTFTEVIGQDHISQTLENAISSGRIAHAYLFTGPRGVGKTTTARIFAKALNCDKGTSIQPCNVCKACIQITEGNSLDVLEIDGASNRGIDEIRSLRENINYSPTQGKYKVYIIDEVHMLTEQAFNALLKTLEEPPPRVIFIFATTEPHRIPITILSRCQRYDFKRIPRENIVKQLTMIADNENYTVPDAALQLIARKAEGSMRDSESIFDQVISFCGNQIRVNEVEKLLGVTGTATYHSLFQALKEKNIYQGLELVNTLLYSGADIGEFLTGIMEYIRNLIIIKMESQPDAIFGIPEDEIPFLQQLAESYALVDLYRMLSIATRYEPLIKYSSRHSVQLEMFIFKLFSLNPMQDIEPIILQLKNLVPRQTQAISENKPESHTTENQTIEQPQIDLEQLTILLKQGIETLRNEDKNQLAQYLDNSQITQYDAENRVINLTIKDGNSFIQEFINKRENFRRIELLFNQKQSNPYRIDVLVELTENHQSQSPSEHNQTVYQIKTKTLDDYKAQYPAIDYILNQFNGEIIDKSKRKTKRNKYEE